MIDVEEFVQPSQVAAPDGLLAERQPDPPGRFAQQCPLDAGRGGGGQQGVPAVVMTSSAMPQVADTFRSDKAIAELEAGKIVVFGGGTGNPIFSTDTASALRALEIGADAMFKATMVDGVYDKDPHKYPDAVKYDTLTFTRVLDERLAVMDSTAATLCRDNGLPIVVFDLNEPANIARALQGENVGTIVRE